MLFTFLLFLVFLQPTLGKSGKSYYDILGVSKTGNERDIQKAYRKLALRCHPDKGGDEEKFKEIGKAYEVLSDPQQRKLYDAYGEAGMQSGPGNNPFAGGGDPNKFFQGASQFPGFFGTSTGPAFHMNSFSSGGGTTPVDLSEILLAMMGNGPQGGQRRRGGSTFGSPPSQRYERDVVCSLEDLAKGTTKKLKVTFQGQEKVYAIDVKPGWKEGTKISYRSDGIGGHPITMVFVVKEAPHRFFRREGDNLRYTCWITESQTKGGITVKVPLPTGEVWSHTYSKSKDAIILNGMDRVVPSKGMPIKGGPERGDLILTFRVRRPSTRNMNAKQVGGE